MQGELQQSWLSKNWLKAPFRQFDPQTYAIG
jgi:hypothetical protein